MLGLMQDWPLTVEKVIDHAKANFPRREVVTRSVAGPITRSDYATVWANAKRVTNTLRARGVKLGDRVATLAWTTDRHMEVWYGAMNMGAVLHTVNPRLFPEQIAWIINHAEDKVLFFDATFLPIVEKIAPLLKSVEGYVILSDRSDMPKTALPNATSYEDFIAGLSTQAQWGGFDEQTACGLCYTSGTTGDPKGVLYSHRSNILHAMMANQTDGFGCGAADTVLPIAPMFHANAWAIAFVAPMCGAKLVMPGPKLDGASIYEMMETEGVTFSCAVPTVQIMLLNFMRENNLKLSTLKRVAVGGSAIPEAVLRAYEEDYGVEVIHAWGMTEMSPIGTFGKLHPEHAKLDHEGRIKAKLKQGRAPFGVELKITDDEGVEKPHDGKAFGRLMVRGPAVARSYFKNAGALNEKGECLQPCGFFDTGDVATLDELGIMQITDRAKDVIKSGGEWISSIDIENIAIGAEGVANAAVIGVYHPKWDERPLLVIEPKPGAQPTKEQLLKYLEGKIAKWWTPDDVVLVEKIPLGATGKINKLALRELFKDYRLPNTQAAE
ncbi:long-chain-fatty-acid--CoA ligase [Terricaulis silvestris]|uniref:3-methylmercaptopropionyl-CoA ligase n=1 Tax=Terricaulis silvestris TaxID=2686094 RepID=A0A6I6MWY3_9CAUL|nr:long-chain-fatty-acid--CoA ligase [Terricaulis silvestris]QGZ95713.1 Long-chain-fatty-acid--CoA ligase [Terricaulis silvestris]